MVSRVKVGSLTGRSVARDSKDGKITNGESACQMLTCHCCPIGAGPTRALARVLVPMPEPQCSLLPRSTNSSLKPGRGRPQVLSPCSLWLRGEKLLLCSLLPTLPSSGKADIGVELERPSSMQLPADRKPASRALPPGFGVLPAPNEVDELVSRDLRKDL